MDLAPTILQLAHAEPGQQVDGQSLLPFAREPSRESRRPLLHETGDRRVAFGHKQDAAVEPVPKYKAVRTSRWLYVEYESGERELYDLHADPEQLHSLHEDAR